MTRKRWTPAKEVTPSVLKLREKRKWQIALRRYVLEKNLSAEYAPYFGLDIDHIRKWFEFQFKNGASWNNFAEIWQFDHIIPVTYFDFHKEEDLKLCWNFLNLRIELLQKNKDRGHRLDVLATREYFNELLEKTGLPICHLFLAKIEAIKLSEMLPTEAQTAFIRQYQNYIDYIRDYGRLEFELLNNGRSLEEVRKEMNFINNLKL